MEGFGWLRTVLLQFCHQRQERTPQESFCSAKTEKQNPGERITLRGDRIKVQNPSRDGPEILR
jgi:hypothetical protein